MTNNINIKNCISFAENFIKKRDVDKRLKIVSEIANYGYQGEDLVASIILRDIPLDKNKDKLIELTNERVYNALETLCIKRGESEKDFLERISTKSKIAKNTEFFYRYFEVKEAIKTKNKKSIKFEYVKNTLDYSDSLIKNKLLKDNLLELFNTFKNTSKLEEDEEIYVERKVKKISDRYNFTFQYMHDLVFINSKFDKWYFEYYDGMKTISLFHRNKNGIADNYHFQRNFTNKYATIEEVFKYINKHDNYVMYRKYDFGKIDRLLEKNKSVRNQQA